MACSSFDVAKGSSIASSRCFRKSVSCSIPTSNTVDTWLNSGTSGQELGEKRLLPGVGFPDGHLFLGKPGPLAERGIREIRASLGRAAKLTSPLGPHDLRHTFAKALLDPAAYGLDRPPMPLPALRASAGPCRYRNHDDLYTGFC